MRDVLTNDYIDIKKQKKHYTYLGLKWFSKK